MDSTYLGITTGRDPKISKLLWGTSFIGFIMDILIVRRVYKPTSGEMIYKS